MKRHSMRVRPVPTRPRSLLALVALAIAGVAFAHTPAEAQGWGIRPDQVSFRETIQRVVGMPSDSDLQRRTQALGLNVVNVMWEDTGRFQGSSVGPNISDVTLQVREPLANGTHRTHLLPVIRHPNFSDRTADIRSRDMWIRVGNHREGEQLHPVPLREVLSNLKAYLSDPTSLIGEDDFTAPRDTHYLVSAQHVFVPLSARGTAEFNPVIYNYQSQPESPAVMVLLVTRQGMSATIIENRSGDQSFQGWGQQLFHNHEGQRTMFTAERRSAVQARIEQGEARAQDAGALEEGADMMMLIQVPLRHRSPRFQGMMMDEMAMGAGGAVPQAMPSGARRSTRGRSDVEQAVIGHGDALGPFREMGNLRLQRDPRFPVRVTVQLYKATSNGVISDADLQDAHRQIEAIYENGEFVGSLVVPRSDRTRPTEWRRLRRRWVRCPPGARCR